MYNIPFPVARIRTRMRQEFERQRYTDKLPVVDVLLSKHAADYQVRIFNLNSERQRGERQKGTIDQMLILGNNRRP